MKTRLLLFVMLLMSFAFNSFGQRWMDMMEDPNANYYDVVRAAEAYFKIHGTARGSGYKVFKRWEYLMKDQIDANGNRLDPQNTWREHARVQSEFSRSRIAATTTGNWVEKGPKSWNRTTGWNPGVGRVDCIAIDPNNNNVIYIGAPGGGCWKSTNGGTTWSTTTDNLPVMTIASVIVDPTNSNIVYIGTSGGGVLKSTNAGSTWASATSGIPSNATINKLIVDPSNASIVIAATSSGIYRTANGGSSWTQSASGGFNDVEFKPGATATVYASGNSFFRSTNNGVNFSQITNGITTSDRSFISVTPANPNYVYMVQARGSEFGYFYRSTDGGSSFQLRVTGNAASGTNYFGYSPNGTDTGGQAWYDMAMCVSTTNAEEVYIGGIIIWKTTNGGSSFTAMTEWIYPNSRGYTHPDMHALEYVGNTIYSGSDGGIYKSTNQGGDWTDLSTGLGIRMFYRIGCAKTDATIVGGGAQDNGCSIMKSTGWIDWLGADGMETMIDHTNPNIVYGTTQNGGLNKSTNGGASTTSISTPSGSGNWVTPWVMDPVNSSILYLGYNEIFKTTNGGGAWTKISNFGFSSGVDALQVAPSNPSYLYAAKGNTIYVTKNGGASWTNISAGVSGNVNYITVHPDNAEKVAISTSGGNKVYTSSNGGTNWTNISSGLPNITANCVVYQKGSQDGLYVGMNVGVYYRDNNLNAWIPFMTQLPKVSVRELEVHVSSGKIRAATHGRGLWESDLYSSSGNIAPTITITSPSNGATYTAPASVVINVNASDADGSVTNVQFFNGTTQLGSDNTAPYSFTWSNVAAGTYTITAKATDNGGATTTSAAITIIVNPAAGNATVYQHCNFDLAGYAVTLNAGDYTAAQLIAKGIADNDISSLKVQSGYEIVLYELDNFLGASQTFSADDPCLVDNSINDWASSVRVRAIVVNQPPVVSITAPLNNASFIAPANITITANATDDVGVTNVQFFNGATQLGSDNTAPYSFVWNGVAAGTYQLTAKATDGGGLTTTSSVITITVVANQPPVVSITSPANNATFTAPATFTIVATATDDISVSSVQFFNGATSLGTDNTSPYTFAWSGVAAGTYQLTAKATDGAGLTTTSAVITVIVNPAPVLRDPENPSVTVNGLDYSYYEGNWSALPAFASLTPVKTGTVANYDLAVRNRDDQFGFQFKGFVNVPTDGQYTFYTSSDDGSRLFIGSTMVVDNDGLHGTVEKSGTIGLKAGKHAVTVIFFEQGGGEVLTVSYYGPGIAKQAIPGSALFRIPPANVAPTVSITAPANNATFTAPANITITANAADSDGSITNVQFFNGTTSLGSDNTSPYSFAWNGVASGTYTLTAKATDNSGAITTSSVITITVTTPAGCQIPTALSASAVTTSTATLNWAAQAGAVSYLVWWRPVGGSWTTNATVTTNSANVGSLLSGTQYEFTVRTNCSGSSSAFTTPYLRFTTLSPNAVPSVSITSPANNASFTGPASITFTANATDSDGSITKVEYFNGATSLGIGTGSTYSFTWGGVAAGTYSITAKATDNSGAIATSGAVSVTVTANTSDACATTSQYVENNGYVDGSMVKNAGSKYQCKPWPYSGWCNGAAWAYEPGVGAYWTDAWTLIGSCTPAAAPAPAMNEEAPEVLAAPHPFLKETTVSLNNNEKILSVTVLDIHGKEIMSTGSIDASEITIGDGLEAGMYIVHVVTETGSFVKNIIKTE